MASANNTPAVNKSELSEALTEARVALTNGVKKSAGNSLKLGGAVTIVAFSAQLAIIGAVAAIASGQGVLDGIKKIRTERVGS